MSSLFILYSVNSKVVRTLFTPNYAYTTAKFYAVLSLTLNNYFKAKNIGYRLENLMGIIQGYFSFYGAVKASI